MANKRRGEIDAILDGRSYTLCLTLGALAELEQAFDANDILSLAERFERGRISAGEALKILAAGLKGGGYTLTIDEIAEMRADGGAAGYVRIVAELLAVSAMQTGLSARFRTRPSMFPKTPSGERQLDQSWLVPH